MLLPLQKARQLGPIGCLRNWSYAPKTQPVQLIRGPMTKQDSCLGESWSAGSKLPLWCRRSGFEFAMARAQLAFRFTFLDVMDGQMDADRARGRSLSPMRPATREVLVQDAWAQRHLRTLRQGQNATVVDTTAPSRGSVGHPTLCNKPCIFIARRRHCQKGMACSSCHHQHNDPKLDKKQRLLMNTMPRSELLGLLADLLRECAEQDGIRDVSFVVAVARRKLSDLTLFAVMKGELLHAKQSKARIPDPIPTNPTNPSWGNSIVHNTNEVLSVQAGLLPGRLQTKSRQLHNLRQVPNFKWSFLTLVSNLMLFDVGVLIF